MKDYEEYDDCSDDCCGHDHDHCDCGHDHCDCGHHHHDDEGVALDERQVRTRLLNVVALANNYCVALENAGDYSGRASENVDNPSENEARAEFVIEILDYLPRLYWEFSDLQTPPTIEEETYLPQYVDEDYYESIRHRVGSLMGEEDVFLETFEEDMKYSDTPIAASISESLADIFQNLYDFVAAVRESDGDLLVEAFTSCKENFISTWSQTLCNVLRALNHLRYNKL